jgi:hypothetical protein
MNCRHDQIGRRSTHQAMRAIGAGFQSVLFADIRSVQGHRPP